MSEMEVSQVVSEVIEEGAKEVVDIAVESAVKKPWGARVAWVGFGIGLGTAVSLGVKKLIDWHHKRKVDKFIPWPEEGGEPETEEEIQENEE